MQRKWNNLSCVKRHAEFKICLNRIIFAWYCLFGLTGTHLWTRQDTQAKAKFKLSDWDNIPANQPTTCFHFLPLCDLKSWINRIWDEDIVQPTFECDDGGSVFERLPPSIGGRCVVSSYCPVEPVVVAFPCTSVWFVFHRAQEVQWSEKRQFCESLYLQENRNWGFVHTNRGYKIFRIHRVDKKL